MHQPSNSHTLGKSCRSGLHYRTLDIQNSSDRLGSAQREDAITSLLGKLTARDRKDLVLDADTLRPIDTSEEVSPALDSPPKKNERDQLPFLGFLDRCVNSGVGLVDLDEVETVIKQVGVVDSVAVIVTGDQALVAHLSLTKVCRKNESAVLDYLEVELQHRLSSEQLPSMIVIHDQLPRVVDGGFDYQTLQRWTPQSDLSADADCPQTTTETIILALFQETLGAGVVGCNDDFKDCGGQAIQAFGLIRAIGDQFDISLPIGVMREHRTVRQLARLVDTWTAGGHLAG